MRIDKIRLRNFRCFEDFELELHDRCTVLVGKNGAGKTSILSGLSIALGIWHAGNTGTGWRKIEPHEIRLAATPHGDRLSFEPCKPVSISARGKIAGTPTEWTRQICVDGSRTTNADADVAIREIKASVNAAVQNRQPLPVLAFYGAGRGWSPSNKRTVRSDTDDQTPSRWDAYYDCLNERIRIPDLLNWFMIESAARDPAGRFRPGFETVRIAIERCVPGAESVTFDHQRLEPVVRINGESRLFSMLSDGQKIMAAMVADIAIKAVTLNAFLLNGDEAEVESGHDLPIVLRETPGVVLIDELDVHLHPSWQRRVVVDLMETFPGMQFVCTTHSPQIIGELREGLFILDGGRACPISGAFGLDSSRVLEEVMDAPSRNVDVESRINEISNLIDAEDFESATQRLAELAQLIGDGDPEVTRAASLMAFLEGAEE